MKLTIRWRRVVAVCLGLCLATQALSGSAAEHVIVMVGGEKPEVSPGKPARPQVVRDSNQPTTTVVASGQTVSGGVSNSTQTETQPAPTKTSDRKSTRLNSSHIPLSRMPSSA